MASISRSAPIHLGLDVHKDTISVGILPADQQIPDVERIAHDEASIRRLACRLGHPRMLRACYQHRPDRLRAGPAAAQHGDQLPGDRPVADPQSPRATRPETDRRDCRRLTAAAPRRRAGRHPHPDRPGGGGAGSVSHQRRHGPRPDPCPQPARQILAAPRAGVAGGATWTLTHQAWLGSQRLTWPWSRSVTRNPTPWRPTLPAGAIGRRWTRLVARLAAYRGVTRLGALRLAAPGR